MKAKRKGGFKTAARREVREFLRSERGRISKHAVVAMGSILASAAFAALVSEKRVKAIDCSSPPPYTG